MVVEYRDRLEQAMKDVGMDTTALAEGLKVSYQAVRKVLNGGRFGTENNAKAAKLLGVSSDWLATGKGAKAAAHASAAPSVGPKKGDFVDAVTAEEMELVRHFRHLLPSDRKAAIQEMAKLGAEREAQRKEMLEEAGLTGIMERAAKAARNHTASTSVDPNDPSLKQQPLPGLE